MAPSAKIRDEALNRSQVDAMFAMLIDGIGPRLTASPEHKRAAEWAREHGLEGWTLQRAVEPFEFGRGWTLDKFTLEMVEPRYMPLLGYPEAWSPSTTGEAIVPAVSLAGKSAEDVEAMQAQLKNAAILQAATVTNFIAPTARNRPPPTRRHRVAEQGRRRRPDRAPRASRTGWRGGRGGRGRRRADGAAHRCRDPASGAAVLLKPSRGDARHGLPRRRPRVRIRTIRCRRSCSRGEHYNMIARMLRRGMPVKLRVNVQSHFLTDDPNSYNVIAELPGTDPALKSRW